MADDAQLGVVAVVVAVPLRVVAALKMADDAQLWGVVVAVPPRVVAADPKLRAAVVAVPRRVVAAL